ncbi:MAG: hypothetical protein IJR28_01550, partial [Ottowia sp.]|nr:hypothetical protein [Ottowia sp.]
MNRNNLPPKHNRLAQLSIVLLAFAPLFLRLWRSATCGADCGAGSMLGLFSDALTGGAFLALALACPRA